MKRRSFLRLMAGAGVWPVAARSEQDRARRVAILINFSRSDPLGQAYFESFVQHLQALGWIEGRNLYIEARWPGADPASIQKDARELVTLHCDVIVTTSTPITLAVQRETSTTPIVFIGVSDPVGEGFVSSLANPGGNITGFINYEGLIAGKWLQLLKEIDPRVTRTAFLFNPDVAPRGGDYFRIPFEAAAKSLAITPIAVPVRNDDDIEAAVLRSGREPGGGLVIGADSFMGVHRAKLAESAARYRVPAVYPFRTPVEGGLLSYGPAVSDFYNSLGPYVDRILRGDKPSELPVQVPTKIELVINLRTATMLGLEVPATLLSRADEVIE